MKRTQLIVGATVISLASLFMGVALAGGRGAPTPAAPLSAGLATAHAAMHTTPAMDRMHANMPPALQAKCDAMHADMSGMMGGAGMGPGSPSMAVPSVGSPVDPHHGDGGMMTAATS